MFSLETPVVTTAPTAASESWTRVDTVQICRLRAEALGGWRLADSRGGSSSYVLCFNTWSINYHILWGCLWRWLLKKRRFDKKWLTFKRKVSKKWSKCAPFDRFVQKSIVIKRKIGDESKFVENRGSGRCGIMFDHCKRTLLSAVAVVCLHLTGSR